MVEEEREVGCVLEQDLRDSDGNGGVGVGDTAAVQTVVVNDSDDGFEAMEMEENDFWVEKGRENMLLDMNDASVLCGDFPSLPELPCMSSSSSSSSAIAAAQIVAATPSSSSAASSSPETSWGAAVPKRRKNQTEAGHAAVAIDAAATPSELDGLMDADCINILENMGYMDLMDSKELWDPASLFENQEISPGLATAAAAPSPPPPQPRIQNQEESDGFGFLRGNKELSAIFLDWLKQNRDYISAEDVRKIKLNRSTIENASKRLGGTKEGMKRLLKLILQWVEQHQLQKKRQSHPQYQENADLNPILNPSNSHFSSYVNLVSPDNSSPCSFNPTPPCMIPSPPPQVLESSALVAPPPGLPPPAAGYSNIAGAIYPNSTVPMPPVYNHHPHQQVTNVMPYTQSSEYQMMNNAQAWTPQPCPVPVSSQFSYSADNVHPVSSYQQVFVGNPYPVSAPNGETLVRLGSSATKEARKNRMARQKRLFSNHHRHNNHQNQVDSPYPEGSPASPHEDLMYSYASDSPSTPSTEGVLVPPAENSDDRVKQASMEQKDLRGQSYSDQCQNACSRPERNLKFLLQKVLKQSDVGNLGRIVLPKKEAETHLPELENRDGITIPMEDIGASRVWNMRYRFWPNNKSRMYLLENTGDFVKVNGLQEGDFIVIYLDTKCGKYMIRGVKVREPGTKSDAKKPTARRNAGNLSRIRNRSSPVRIQQAMT